MCEIMDRWVNEVKAEGYANGEKVSAMRTCMDFGKSKSETAAYLTKTLHLSMDEAAKAVEDYWDASKQAQ